MAALTPVVLCLSESGAATARRVADGLGAALHGRAGRVAGADAYFADARGHVAELFLAGRPVIGVCAAGILIRSVAPFLADKRVEPPVIAVAEDGSAVVPLLGGHRGANALAGRISGVLGVTAAMTTAGDLALGVALDAPPEGWLLANPRDAKGAMAALLGGAGPRIEGENIFGLAPGDGPVTIIATETDMPGGPQTLVYHPRRYALGLGCARGCDPAGMRALVRQVLAGANVAAGAVACVVSLDLKADEPAMNEAARWLGVPLRLFSAVELEVEADRLANPSEVVFAEVGCHGVAEGAALAAAGAGAELVVPKVKSADATCALARSDVPIIGMPGRARGKLSLVGIGPGQAAWRTPEATRLIAAADELVGYGLYIDLLGPLAAGKPRSDFPLGGEEDRCRHALERAGEGHDVALVCSGDAGIYAMGALVFELLDRAEGDGGVSAAARRVEVVSAPGISALQAAAARAGAPLGHDFCAISLSDLLTPRDDILRRVRAAAAGDFVVAFYNPVSKRRRTLLAEARDILLTRRPGDTPVLLAASLGRAGERLRYVRLDALAVDDVDMLTVVLVGAGTSRLAELGEGPRMYTPRGYGRRIDGDLA